MTARMAAQASIAIAAVIFILSAAFMQFVLVVWPFFAIATSLLVGAAVFGASFGFNRARPTSAHPRWNWKPILLISVPSTLIVIAVVVFFVLLYMSFQDTIEGLNPRPTPTPYPELIGQTTGVAAHST